jgi:predicted transposase YbfD/YdcC
MPRPIAPVFDDLRDPRIDTANERHALTDILTIATGAVISGAESGEQIAEYGRRQEAFFRRSLAPPNGAPSHDTFYRVFAAPDPDAFAGRFGRWMAGACEGTGPTPIALDGTSARRAKPANATGCLHVVSAWATANRLTLGPVVAADGTGEVGVIPDRLGTLGRAGAIVTIAAAGCQVANARIIREQEGHDLLAVKGNQPALRDAARAVFDRACEADFPGVRCDTHESVAGGHGRREERYVTAVYGPPGVPADWPDVAAVIPVGRARQVKGTNASTAHSYLTSHAGTAAEMAGPIRSHRGIESGLHGVLDVAFREDQSRTRDPNAGANLAMPRRVAVSPLERGKAKGSIQTRRLMAAWDDEFLLQVLRGLTAVHSA